MHANNLRKFNLRVDKLECDLLTGELDREYEDTDIVSSVTNTQLSDEPFTGRVNSCKVVYDKDSDFGSIVVVELPVEGRRELMPSQKLTSNFVSIRAFIDVTA